MRTTQQFSITLPNEMANAVKSKVADGEYATESEVIQDALRSLMARDRALEHWLRTKVAAACDEINRRILKAVTGEEVRARLSALHERTVKANA